MQVVKRPVCGPLPERRLIQSVKRSQHLNVRGVNAGLQLAPVLTNRFQKIFIGDWPEFPWESALSRLRLPANFAGPAKWEQKVN